jgi:hypothetical protein
VELARGPITVSCDLRGDTVEVRRGGEVLLRYADGVRAAP